jgi:hypothetical protein
MSRPVIVSKVIDATAGTIVDPSGELRKYGVQGADIASAATINLAAASGDYVRVTGTTNISNLGSAVAGMTRTVEFTGILTLIYNSSNLILPGGVNLVTSPSDAAIFRNRGGNSWICVSYQKATGNPTTALTPADVGLGNVENIKLSTWAGSTNLTTLGTVTTGVWQAVAIGTSKGGTGLTTVSQGDVIHGAAGNAFARLAKTASSPRYLSNTGVNNDPSWQQINLASGGVTGILPAANGGVGAAIQDLGTPTGASLTIDLSLGGCVLLDMGSASGNITLTLTNPAPGLLCFISVRQGATARSLIFPTGTRQPLAAGNTWVSTAPSKRDVVTFFYDGAFYNIVGTAPDMA